MRLATYDRRGHRRLGAFLEGEVVDLPDLVGHPAFPTTMEALVSAHGGTVMDAARAALERDEAARFVLPNARLLAPLLPSSLRSPDASFGVRRVLGPGDELTWPTGAGWLHVEPKVAAVLGRRIRNVDPDGAARAVFGYMLVADWSARGESGSPDPTSNGLPVSLGPSVATVEEIDPQTTFVTVRVDKEERVKGNLNGAARNLLEVIARASRLEELLPGDVFGFSPFRGLGSGSEWPVWPGAVVEIEAERIGSLVTRIGART